MITIIRVYFTKELFYYFPQFTTFVNIRTKIVCRNLPNKIYYI